ncbi:hypothetical protein L6164_026101 [Bauhinia variegata]|uniref:Uncharacterized protein n=1 Tax=Bauhinia variegata TaxID=167791 RepID=A0ACB9M2C3_BAUVA|nr:hypothetical protein L6164_026101 [Bauhinia variegata]
MKITKVEISNTERIAYCLAYIYPEGRLEPQARSATPPISTENVEREYLEYNDAKTVFRGDACDDLGGIFCEHDYQRRNFKRKE